jgi:flagellar biosynthesis GTPase FlhF
MDETSTYGAILNETVRTSCPVSLLTTGQAVPEDLEIPTSAGLTALILGNDDAQERTASAAA